jgi:hypothetical protein
MATISTRKLVRWTLAGVFLILLIMIFTPVPTPTADNTFVVEGKVTQVISPCCEDIRVRLEDDKHYYHINRGLERGIDLAAFEKALLGKTVTVEVIRTNWTPLDPGRHLRPVAQILDGEKEVYNWSLGIGQ